MTPDTLHHSVYFWLRDGGTPDDAQTILHGCQTYLPEIPGILRLAVGTPAATDGPPVEKTYAVALLIDFVDKAAHDAYDVHPSHQRFVAECGPLCSRIQVFDVAAA